MTYCDHLQADAGDVIVPASPIAKLYLSHPSKQGTTPTATVTPHIEVPRYDFNAPSLLYGLRMSTLRDVPTRFGAFPNATRDTAVTAHDSERP